MERSDHKKFHPLYFLKDTYFEKFTEQLHRGYMGIDLNSAKFLVSSLKQGVSFEKTITLGRQGLLFTNDQLTKILLDDDCPSKYENFSMKEHGLIYADTFFHLLGAHEVLSVDFSAYEGATIIHDMNTPIPDRLKDQFDVVFDGGTLEHVFNFPIALKNCLEMVKMGGRFITHTPSNNYCGHGFYQFSPELFFRALSITNGFHIERFIAVDMEGGRLFSVIDPEKIKRRVELINFHPTQLFIQAKKISQNNIFKINPQQSDYTIAWEGRDMTEMHRHVEPISKNWRHSFTVFLAIHLSIVLDIVRLLFSKNVLFRDKESFKSLTKMQ
jgi:SAM-dependent methyltransferase